METFVKPIKMEELIVDDIPIFTRVHKKCLLLCSILVLQKYAKRFVLGKFGLLKFWKFQNA